MPGPALNHMIADRLILLICLNKGVHLDLIIAQYAVFRNLIRFDKDWKLKAH